MQIEAANRGKTIPREIYDKRAVILKQDDHKQSSDEELVRLFVKTKDQEAFSELVNRI